jgi:hypothetical protein
MPCVHAHSSGKGSQFGVEEGKLTSWDGASYCDFHLQGDARTAWTKDELDAFHRHVKAWIRKSRAEGVRQRL